MSAVTCTLVTGSIRARARARIGEPWATVGWRCPRFWRSPAILCPYKDPFSATSNPCTGFAYHGLACAGHVRQGGRRKARVGRCACAPTPTSPPSSRRFSSLAAASAAGSRSPLEQVRGRGEILAQGHRAWGRDRDPLGSDCCTKKRS